MGLLYNNNTIIAYACFGHVRPTSHNTNWVRRSNNIIGTLNNRYGRGIVTRTSIIWPSHNWHWVHQNNSQYGLPQSNGSGINNLLIMA